MTVALSWGHALQSMVYATTSDLEFHGLNLVQLVGVSSISNEISGQELVRELAVRLKAQYRFLHAPATFESARSRDALLAEPSIADALAEASRADLAFVGIGTPVARLVGGDPRRDAPQPREQSAFLVRPAGRRRRRPLLRRPGPAGPRRGRDRILGAASTSCPSPTSSGSPRAGRRRPASSGRSAATSSTPWSATTLARSLLSEARTSPNDTGGI